MKFLLDTSVIVAALLADEAIHARAQSIVAAMAQDDSPIFVCDIVPQELANALARLVRRGRMDEGHAQAAFAWWHRHPHMEMIMSMPEWPEAMRLSMAGNGHVYDLVQVLAAVRHGARLLTADRRLTKALASSELADRAIYIADSSLDIVIDA